MNLQILELPAHFKSDEIDPNSQFGKLGAPFDAPGSEVSSALRISVVRHVCEHGHIISENEAKPKNLKQILTAD